MATDSLQTGELSFFTVTAASGSGHFKMASLWMLHGTGVQVKCIGHVLEGERRIDLKSLLVTFFRLPQALFQAGLSISHLRVLFFNGLYFI